jgi:very-short-patch-repair endonuclease
MPRGRGPAPLPPPLRHKLFTRAEAIAHGLTPAQLRGPMVCRVFRGLYCDPAVSGQLNRLLLAALQVVPSGSAIAGLHCAAMHDLPLPLVTGGHGIDLLERLLTSPLHVCVPATGTRKNHRPGMEIRFTALTSDHVLQVGGVAVLAPARLLLELAADGWDRVDLVALVDAALHSHRVTSQQLTEALRWGARRRGCRLARAVVDLADAGAESPMETRLRLIIVDAGLPGPQTNRPVKDGSRTVARPDLSYPEWKIAIEYDGADHATSPRRARDEARRVALRERGWTVLTFTSHEVLVTPEVVVARVRAEIGRASRAASAGLGRLDEVV